MLVTPVMSGPPSAAAPTVKLTVTVEPLPNGSPDQLPGPEMSASVVPLADTDWPPWRAWTRTLAVPASLTNETFRGRSVTAVKPSAGLRSTEAIWPDGSVDTSTVSDAPNSGNVTESLAATTADDGGVDDVVLSSSPLAPATPPKHSVAPAVSTTARVSHRLIR